MLLLPLAPSLIYLKLKRFKGPKMDFTSLHFTSLFTSLFTHKHGGRRSIAGIKESFEGYRPPSPMVVKEIPFKFSTCKTSAGVKFYKRNPFKFFLRSPSIFKRNPIKKNRLQFYMEIPLLFSKNHKLETIFEKSHRSSVILKILENFSNLSKI